MSPKDLGLNLSILELWVNEGSVAITQRCQDSTIATTTMDTLSKEYDYVALLTIEEVRQV